MIEVRRTAEFISWLKALRDPRAKAKIASRISRLQDGNLGDVKPVGEGISELRVHYGPGYRIYLLQRGQSVVVLLCGGDKSTQERDIREAKVLAADLTE